MTRPDVVERRLAKMDEMLRILEGMRRYAWSDFAADPEKYGSAERFLQLSIEALNDLGAHAVARLELGRIVHYRDVPEALERAGNITEAQRDLWIRIIGFRNVLVHGYLDVDRRLVYDMVQDRLDDLRDLMATMARELLQDTSGERDVDRHGPAGP